MRIEKQISELLYEHDCVIVPAFGGFVCNYSSAGIHLDRHRFYPPFKKISFNRNLKNNDGLLANQVAQAEGISYADSNRLIADYVEHLNKELDFHKRFNFKNVGTIYRGEENTLLFEQDETANYLPDSFGLSTFNVPPVKREPIGRRMEKKLKDKVVLTPREKNESVITKRRLPRYAIASAVVLLIGVLAWIPFETRLVRNIDYSTLNPFVAEPQPLYLPSEIDFSNPDKEITKESASTLLAMASDTLRYLNIVIDGRIPVIVRLKEDDTAVVKTKKRDPKPKNDFHIVGGAFALSENAEKFYTKLIRDGYNARILENKEKNIRFVSYGGFSTKEEAMQMLEKIRAVQNDVWLMTN